MGLLTTVCVYYTHNCMCVLQHTATHYHRALQGGADP